MSLHDNADVVSCCRWFPMWSPRFSPRREQQFRHPPMPEVSLRTFGASNMAEAKVELTGGCPRRLKSAARLPTLVQLPPRGPPCTNTLPQENGAPCGRGLVGERMGIEGVDREVGPLERVEAVIEGDTGSPRGEFWRGTRRGVEAVEWRSRGSKWVGEQERVPVVYQPPGSYTPRPGDPGWPKVAIARSAG